MNRFITFIVVVLMVELASAQTWERMNPLPEMDNLNHVTFVTANQGWAVGDNGTIAHTEDAGETWTLQVSGEQDTLLNMAFVTENRGWAVGHNGTILHTANGGETWEAQTSGTINPLRGAAFANENNGWVVGNGGVILHTTDGGELWLFQASNTGNDLYAVECIDENHVWIAGSEIVLYTENGGVSWTIQTNITEAFFPTIDFVNSTTGWLGGSKSFEGPFGGSWGILVHTTDGGGSWTTDSLRRDEAPVQIHMLDSNHGWYLENPSGEIYRTTDGGVSWISQTESHPSNPNAIAFTDLNHGYAVGYYGAIHRSTDGGDSWAFRPHGMTYSFSGASFITPHWGWIAGGDGTILKTTDTGSSWIAQDCGTSNGIGSVYFLNSRDGWITAGFPSGMETPGWGTVRRTTDGGISWADPDTSLRLSDPPCDIAFADQNHGWMVPDPGWGHEIWYTANGGLTWEAQDLPVQYHMLGLAIMDSLYLYAVGTEGTVLFTSNGGTNWYAQNCGTTQSLHGVDIYGPRLLQRVWAVGRNGTIVKYHYSHHWISQVSGTNMDLNDVDFVDNNTGWAVGDSGTILSTSNGGTTWTLQPGGTRRQLNEVCFTDANHGWAVGDYGTILRYDDGMWSPDAEAQTPVQFILEQNYPNPFNSTTTFAYELHTAGYISLLVFDLLGREVAVLKNGFVNAGRYHVSFNGDGLASGIYFARLEAGKVSQTKKLVLIK